MAIENIDWLQVVGWIVSGGIGGIVVGGIFQYYLDKKLVRYNLVSESQFKAFNNLWMSLMNLKIKADGLWENPNDMTLLSFASLLRKVTEDLDVNTLILYEEDYNDLKKILNKFGEYQIGKTRLIDIDKGKINAERRTFTTIHGANVLYDNRLNQVFQNESLKNEYKKLLEELRKKFQNKIGVK